MEVTKRAKTEELAQSKVRREIKSFDDGGLWAEFEPEGIDRILSGEIKPKTLITGYGLKSIGFPQRGALIAKEMLSVFPNSRYAKWEFGNPYSLKEVMGVAKERGCTSLVIAYTNAVGHDEICTVSLMNGARAYLRVLDLIPREDIPDQASPPRRLYPELHMDLFTSPASVGTARLIQSLFPKVTHPRRKNVACFQNQNGHVFYRHYWLHVEKADLAGERPRVTRKECGPRFGLRLTGLSKVALDTGKEKDIFMPPLDY
uniref:Brix domain-containing protein n=1 Tax=Noccaea caerulescens TaxID=107243 RepID=A0A1J3II78_NOCCA